MKILHIIPTYLPAYRYGGPIKSVHELNKWLVKKGIDVTVYTTNLDGDNFLSVPLNQEVDIDGVKVVYSPLTFRAWEYSRAMRKAIKENIKNFDLVHITSVFLSASTLGAHYARKFNKPYIISPRGSLMIETLKKKRLKKKIYLSLIEKRNLAGAAAIHFTTELEKNEYLKAGLPLKKAIIIPNGLDLDSILGHPTSQNYGNIRTSDVQRITFREKFGIGNDKKIVLFLSRISWKKGFDALIPAFAEVVKKEPKAVLVIAGPDSESYLKKILKIIDDVNKRTSDVQKLKSSIFGTSDVQKIENPNIVFTGMLLGEDKIAAYKESDLFVLPSYAENFGMAVVEAMYFGLPVVITENVGIALSVYKANAGMVIKKDAGLLSSAILRILRDNDLARQMAENGRKLVQSEFSWPQIADKFIAEYNKLN